MNPFDSAIVKVSKEDKEKLIYLINEIKSITDKYKYSNDYSLYYVTSMSRVKNFVSDLHKWIGILPVEINE